MRHHRRKGIALLAAVIAIEMSLSCGSVHAAIDNRDAIERAVGQRSEFDLAQEDHLNVLIGEQFSYDNNVFRLPDYLDVAGVVGANSSRQDRINSQSLELDGRRTLGRQVFTLDVRADNHRYDRNDDLNNVSTRNRLAWAWELGDQLSGQLGVDYNKSQATFVNTTVYTRNLVTTTDYFAAGRYQLGPHWGIFGALLGAETTLSAATSKTNNNKQKSGDLGTEYALSSTDAIGIEYRYTDTTFPRSLVPDETNYKEQIERVLFKHAFSERTLLDASFGYLKRTYSTSIVRDFSGNVWRATLEWQGSDKTQIFFDAWRKLQAYETAETNYFATTGGSISPVWKPTDKISLAVDLTYDNERYLGGGGFGVSRHDTVRAEHGVVTYTPRPLLILSASVGFENRSSDAVRFAYSDRLLGLNASLKF